jgi:hypothetical protein
VVSDVQGGVDPEWVYPNAIVDPGQHVSLAGLTFSVVDLGAGGDSDANAIWLLEDDRQVACVGDFLYSKKELIGVKNYNW